MMTKFYKLFLALFFVLGANASETGSISNLVTKISNLAKEINEINNKNNCAKSDIYIQFLLRNLFLEKNKADEELNKALAIRCNTSSYIDLMHKIKEKTRKARGKVFEKLLDQHISIFDIKNIINEYTGGWVLDKIYSNDDASSMAISIYSHFAYRYPNGNIEILSKYALNSPIKAKFDYVDKSIALGGSSPLTYSNDGLTLADGIGKTVVILDAITGIVLHELKGHTDTVQSISYSKNDLNLASSDKKTIKIWNLTNGKLIKQLALYAKDVKYSKYNNQLIFGSWFGMICVLDLESDKVLNAFRSSDNIQSLAYSSEGKFLASCSHGRINQEGHNIDCDKSSTISIWNGTSGVGPINVHVDGSVIKAIFFSNNKYLAIAVEQGYIYIFDADKINLIQKLKCDGDTLYSIAFYRDGKFLAVLHNAGKDIWRYETIFDGYEENRCNFNIGVRHE